jgi:putative ATPase
MTTANPYIAINPAIRSRCHLLEVKPLSREDIVIGINRALSSFNGLDNHISMDDDAKKLLATLAGGDLRFAYNYLEVLSLSKNQNISMDDIKSVIRVPNYLMDQNEEEHYDSVSALQKSIRGSDVDAALYYLARLCAANDLESIERRLLVTAYEDIGLANPQAVERCAIALESARKVGFPEAVIPLGFTVCDLALSPKSKAAATSIQSAMDYAKDHQLNVLDYLKLTPVNAQEIDKYPYDRPDLWEKMQYLPELIKEMQFYQESDASQYEKVLNANYHRLKKNARTSNLAFLKSKKPRE